MRLHPFSKDPDPSPIGLHMLSDEVARLRVRRPAVRKSWLEQGPGAAPERRGQEPFVELPNGDEPLDLVAAELRRVKETHSNRAIFGGSYGWSSAGRFHHAQSQVHRFLNAIGGYVRHLDSYSLGAARVLMPHIVAPMDELMSMHTPWDVLAEHCKLFVTFGGVPHKNSQINAGGATRHHVKGGLYGMRAKGVRFVNVTPTADDLDTGGDVEWLAIRPNTDTALMLALCHTLLDENLHDRAFLDRCTVGFDKFAPSLAGRTPEWAEGITGIPAARIRAPRARDGGDPHHGQHQLVAAAQPSRRAAVLGAGDAGLHAGPDRPAGRRLRRRATARSTSWAAPSPSSAARPCRRAPTRSPTSSRSPASPTCCSIRAATLPYNGRELTYPDIRLVYWAGGNPFHHHQDLNRLMSAWRKPETIVFNEQFWTPAARMADIVLPATTSLERDDIGYGSREPYLIAMKKAREPIGEARDDYWIFSELARRLGPGEAYTEGRDTMAWLPHLYEHGAREVGRERRHRPRLRRLLAGRHRRGPGHQTASRSCWRPSAPIPRRTRSRRRRARSRSSPRRSPRSATTTAPATRRGSSRSNGWARRPPSAIRCTCCRTSRPTSCTASSTTARTPARPRSSGRQPITLHPDDAAARGIADGDLLRVFNDRGACLAAARLSDRIRRGRRAAVDRRVVRSAGSGSNQPLEKHGNPNALTLDIGASKLSQGCIAQTCLVEIERFDGPAPAVTAHRLPDFAAGD